MVLRPDLTRQKHNPSRKMLTLLTPPSFWFNLVESWESYKRWERLRKRKAEKCGQKSYPRLMAPRCSKRCGFTLILCHKKGTGRLLLVCLKTDVKAKIHGKIKEIRLIWITLTDCELTLNVNVKVSNMTKYDVLIWIHQVAEKVWIRILIEVLRFCRCFCVNH